jgi:hypothetical protein
MEFVKECDSGAGPSNHKSMIHKCEWASSTTYTNTATKQNGEQGGKDESEEE